MYYHIVTVEGKCHCKNLNDTSHTIGNHMLAYATADGPAHYYSQSYSRVAVRTARLSLLLVTQSHEHLIPTLSHHTTQPLCIFDSDTLRSAFYNNT